MTPDSGVFLFIPLPYNGKYTFGGNRMRAVKYIRVSDEEQEREGFSIEAQSALLDRKFAEWGFECVGTYIDPGFSAKNTKRPAFQRMLKELESTGAQAICFWRLDRFTRSTRDFQKIVETLELKKCGIKSATEHYDTTTAIGRFQLDLAISLGQLERETTAERVHFVMEERHRKGLRNGAVAPYGYSLADGQLTLNPQEAEVVRRIYELYQSPVSIQTIAKRFNAEGLPKRELSKWSAFSIQYILTNPVYCGRIRWNYRKLSGKRTYQEIIVDGSHEPIISQQEFDSVQQLKKRRYVLREKVSSPFHFTGVLRCGRCGYGMIGLTQRDNKTGKSKRHYRCLGRVNYGICNMPFVQEKIIVDMFLKAMEEGSVHLRKLLQINEHVPVESNYDQELLKRDLEQIQKRRRKWQDAYANDVIDLETLKGRMEEERAKEEIVKGKLEPAAAQGKSQWSPDEIKEMLTTLRPLWHEIQDDAVKKKFVQDIFKSIVINSPVEKAVARPGKVIPVDIVEINWNI
jgi:site-specific DNA recombinase